MHNCLVFLYLPRKRVCEKVLSDLPIVRKCIRFVRSNIPTKTSFNQCFFSFCGFDWKYYALWQKELKELVKTSTHESRRAVFSFENLQNAQMVSFLVLTAKNSLRKLLGRLVKSVLVLSTVTFWRKLCLWRFVFFFFPGFWV